MYKSITADSSFLLMVDIQERLIQAMFNKDEIIKNSIRILTAAKEFSLPLMVSEQYPQGIGSTIPELKNLLPQDINMINKTEFSCCKAQGFGDAFLNLKFDSGTKDTVILFGIETHICVLATAIDLIEKYNLNVVIAADSCGSRREQNHKLALDTLRYAGCFVVPTETVIYSLLEKSGTPQFKALLPLLK